MRKIRFCFLILHYLNTKDTIECIESILKNLKRNDYRIIVIDNYSFNNSGKELKKIYLNNSKVEILYLKQNYGFAQGNNKGAEYAYNKYTPDFYIAINNDTYINQYDFLDKIEILYKKFNFKLLGPYIYDKNFLPQNTIEYKLINEKLININIIKISIHLLCEYLKIRRFLLSIKNKRSNKEKNYKNLNLDTHILSEKEMLHGAAIIFNNSFYEKYKFLYYPKTFMFVEEDILRYITLKNKEKVIFSSEIKIFHKEDRSTDMLLNKNRNKLLFCLKNQKKSLKVYKELMKLNKNEKVFIFNKIKEGAHV